MEKLSQRQNEKVIQPKNQTHDLRWGLDWKLGGYAYYMQMQ